MNETMTRRAAVGGIAAAVMALVGWSRTAEAQAKTPIVVYKDPNCGCCGQWITHMEQNGFAPSVTNTPKTAEIKDRYKVGEKLRSCHTSIVGGYVIEGHVPASDVRKLLAQKPKNVLGLTIPGMPASAPGMDMEPFQPYTVLTFDEKGVTTVFAKHDKA